MKDIKRLIKYGITGVLTTGVNYAVYFVLWQSGINYLDANAAAWIAAVIFSYFVNRQVVFHSENVWYKEMLSFFSLRFVTLLIETLLLFLAVDGFKTSSAAAKIIISIITVLGNYIFCQKKVFTKGVEQNE